uniref:Urea transport system substrate-binding protein n=1 Tax=Candidatus Kentrum sp. FW TaxID=2126338 RepID=A0A450TWV9_9GAMM|nr:MAG: urea transport system substrate-binding protein [Candidatus Kentron sp. FW]
MNEVGVKRWVLAETDYVCPRTTNKILAAYLGAKGVKSEDIMINYTPFGHSDWQSIVADIKKFGSSGKKTAVVSTINGDANVPFYKELGNQNISAENIPVVAFSVGEKELSGIDTKPLVGHLAAWNYFMSVDDEANDKFITQWHGFTKDEKRVTNDPMETHYIGFKLWVKAVEKAKTTDTDVVGQGHDRRHDAQSHRRHREDAGEPSSDQAGFHRRDPGRRSIRGGVAD